MIMSPIYFTVCHGILSYHLNIRSSYRIEVPYFWLALLYQSVTVIVTVRDDVCQEKNWWMTRHVKII